MTTKNEHKTKYIHTSVDISVTNIRVIMCACSCMCVKCPPELTKAVLGFQFCIQQPPKGLNVCPR